MTHSCILRVGGGVEVICVSTTVVYHDQGKNLFFWVSMRS